MDDRMNQGKSFEVMTILNLSGEPGSNKQVLVAVVAMESTVVVTLMIFTLTVITVDVLMKRRAISSKTQSTFVTSGLLWGVVAHWQSLGLSFEGSWVRILLQQLGRYHGQILYSQLLVWCFGVKLLHSIRAVPGAPLLVVDLKRRYRNSLNK